MPLRELVAVAAIGFLVLLLAMPRDLNIFDEGIILSGAMRILDGEVIHRDFYSLYGPAQFYAVAGILKASDNSFLAARLYDLIVRAAIVAALFYIIRQQCTLVVALLFTTLGGIWMLAVGNYLYPIFPCILLALISSCLVARLGAGTATLPAMVCAGACTGLTALFRYDAGLFLLLAHVFSILMLAWLTEPRGTRLRRGSMYTIAYGAGTALVFAPMTVSFILVSPISAFTADIIDYSTKYYAAMRGLPFPGLRSIWTSPREAAVYLPLLAAGLAGVELVRQIFRRAGPLPSHPVVGLPTASLIVFGTAALLLFLRGVVRVITIHMLIGLVPALVVLAILVKLWWRQGSALRSAAVAVLLLAAIPAADAAGHFATSNLRVKDRSVAGWLVAKSGLVTAFASAACHAGPASGLARLGADYARVATYLAAHTRPNERILVGLNRHDKVFINPVSLYFAAGRLPGTHWHQFDPGLQTRADIQTAIIGDLQRHGVRWVVRDASFDQVQEPNGSARSSGVKLLDTYLDEHYRAVASSGPVAIWLANGEMPDTAPAGPCEAAPVR